MDDSDRRWFENISMHLTNFLAYCYSISIKKKTLRLQVIRRTENNVQYNFKLRTIYSVYQNVNTIFEEVN